MYANIHTCRMYNVFSCTSSHMQIFRTPFSLLVYLSVCLSLTDTNKYTSSHMHTCANITICTQTYLHIIYTRTYILTLPPLPIHTHTHSNIKIYTYTYIRNGHKWARVQGCYQNGSLNKHRHWMIHNVFISANNSSIIMCMLNQYQTI